MNDRYRPAMTLALVLAPFVAAYTMASEYSLLWTYEPYGGWSCTFADYFVKGRKWLLYVVGPTKALFNIVSVFGVGMILSSRNSAHSLLSGIALAFPFAFHFLLILTRLVAASWFEGLVLFLVVLGPLLGVTALVLGCVKKDWRLPLVALLFNIVWLLFGYWTIGEYFALYGD